MTIDTEMSTRAWVEHIMGIPVSVHVRAGDLDRTDISVGVQAVFEELDRADTVFSTWRADSELMRWRRGDLALRDAHPTMRTVMDLCDAATSATGGLFTTNLVGPDGGAGWDPTGLVKGWAVGEAAKNLRTLEHSQFSINAGGDIVCGRGTDSADLTSPWNIGIEDPTNRSRIAHVIPVVEGALATSSSAARGAHIIDPRTGIGVVHPRSTTVTGPDLVWADVWATAAFIDATALEGRREWESYRLRILGARAGDFQGTNDPVE